MLPELTTMTLVKIPASAVAGAGTNRIFADCPTGANLRVVAVINGNTGNQDFRIDLASIGNNVNDSDLNAIPLLHGTQDGLKTVVLQMNGNGLEMSDWRRVVATFYNCTANDGIALAVGYEI